MGRSDLVDPRLYKGFRDIFASDVEARQRMIDTIRGVYERYGFEPLETPAVEYVDVLGKYLPESDTPDGGIFSWRDEAKDWVSLRYDLTAPLSRVVAQYGPQLPKPFRRYQVGPVYRFEKPGPGRFREFYQFDIDSVGTSAMAADAEVCSVLCAALEELGIPRGSYVVRVNNRKVLNGVLERIGMEVSETNERWLTVLRAVDKLDRLGIAGVRQLLDKGRRDESGDFTKGAELAPDQIEMVIGLLQAGAEDRGAVCDRLAELVGDSEVGLEGVDELRQIHALLEAEGLGPDRVLFDPSVVRGLAYYTGPVFEAELTFDVVDEGGERRPFGSVSGGGRYDDLVERFTGQKVPATGASIGVDRLLAALKALGKAGEEERVGPIVVLALDRGRMADYQRMVAELRAAGLRSELYLGGSGFRAQLKYADKRNAPLAIIAGGDEFDRGEVSIKDLRLGKQLAKTIKDRDEWRKGQPAQVAVKRDELVEQARAMLARVLEADDA